MPSADFFTSPAPRLIKTPLRTRTLTIELAMALFADGPLMKLDHVTASVLVATLRVM